MIGLYKINRNYSLTKFLLQTMAMMELLELFSLNYFFAYCTEYTHEKKVV